MKVKEMIAYEGGSVRLTLESEHPAELAMIRLLNGCEAKCESKTPEGRPEQNAGINPTPADPELRINIEVKKNWGY